MAQVADNYLLEQLPAPALEVLLEHLNLIDMTAGETLYEPDDPVDRVIFPTSGVLSVISVMADGATAETSVVGRNGAVGYIEACGSGVMTSRIVVQMAGKAWAAPASRYRTAFENSPDLRRAVAAKIELQVAELKQNLACGRIHKLDKRLARWLLDCLDVSGVVGRLPITQEFLGQMVSAQRSSISGALSELQADELVVQGRGYITVKDRGRLEARACECRRTVARLRQAIQPGATEIHVRGQ